MALRSVLTKNNYANIFKKNNQYVGNCPTGSLTVRSPQHANNQAPTQLLEKLSYNASLGPRPAPQIRPDGGSRPARRRVTSSPAAGRARPDGGRRLSVQAPSTVRIYTFKFHNISLGVDLHY